jgi:lipopolysaccharide export system protein LptA
MHDSSPTQGARRNPVFTVEAALLTTRADGTYTAEGGIHARAEREGEDPVIFTAEEGTIDLENKRADLRGDVELRAGTIHMKLADVAWENNTGTARSERELTFGDGSAALSADAMEINTVNKTYALRNPSGRIRLTQQGESL